MLLCCAVLAASSLPVRAEQVMTDTETLIRLKVRPRAEPKPALRYLLLPDLKELQPGNPIPNYLRCILDQDFSAPQEVLTNSALREADRAARMDKPDWQILLKLKTDGIGLLLPDVQKLRNLAAGLQDRFRAEVAGGRIDDALYTARTMFALSRHMGEHPTLIGDLVGIAIATITIGPLEDLLEQPNCPNLYWALTNLPNPLISIETGLEGERILIQGEFHELDDREPMSAEQIKKLIAHIQKVREFDKKPQKPVRAWVDERAKNQELVRAARGRLVEYGIPEERLARFPADQVILLDARRQYEERRDEVMKVMILPTWQAEELISRIKPAKEEGLLDFLVPAFQKVRKAQGRLEQRIALLRCVEALRLYAAAHDGKLPDKLSECPVPLPDDPFTGKPFRYKLDGSTAHLRGTPPRGQEKIPGVNIHYEITIQK
jgi:hypothetical protein